jgi:hypothetical protein
MMDDGPTVGARMPPALTPRQERLRAHLLDFAREHGRKPNRAELRAILSRSRRGLL